MKNAILNDDVKSQVCRLKFKLQARVHYNIMNCTPPRIIILDYWHKQICVIFFLFMLYHIYLDIDSSHANIKQVEKIEAGIFKDKVISSR